MERLFDSALDTSLLDRDIIWGKKFICRDSEKFRQSFSGFLDPKQLNCGPGKVSVEEEGYLKVEFGASHDEKAISQQLRFILSEIKSANGFGMRVRLRGWKSISYIAIGHTEDGAYKHAKATHPLQDEWFDFNISFHDLAWGWRNGWEYPKNQPIGDVRFYIKGIPGSNAGCDLAEVRVWHEDPQPKAIFGEDIPVLESVFDHLNDYQRAYFPDYIHLARSYMNEGKCPLAGNTLLDWPAEASLPPQLHKNGTFQYSWYSQHPAVMLMLLAIDKNEVAALFSARELVSDWLARGYDRADINTKYAWYDHGVAERVFAMIMLYALGQKHQFDTRFMARLRHAIHRHAQLLASEVFYAGHQPTRYHNHAWFQDLALMTVGLAFPGWACADQWIDTALARATDQFSRLIIRDGNFAIFAENSIGYHFGIGRLVASIGRFATLSRRETDISQIAEALERFSILMRYPGGRRAPSQGDTFRLPNAPEGDPAGREPYSQRQIEVLPKAGYAIAKDNDSGRPFMLAFFATSASATHKHADNLSLTLYMDGIEWLIDPSFHSHEYANALPLYLRGPVAHNALVLPEEKYLITPGLARLVGGEDETGFYFEGEHEAVRGYVFRRRIQGASGKLDLSVTDELEGGPLSLARLMFHCGEGVEARIEAGGLRLRHPASEISLRIELPENCGVTLQSGQEDPIRGVTGLGFLCTSMITTIEITPPKLIEKLIWRIFVE